MKQEPIEIGKGVGRLKKKWMKIIKEDMKACDVDEDKIRDRKELMNIVT